MILENAFCSHFDFLYQKTLTKVELDSDREVGDPDYMQPSMSVDSSQVVKETEVLRQNKMLVRRLCSDVRLYRTKPVPKLCREWRLVDGITGEFPLIHVNGKLDSMLVGGRVEAFGTDRGLIDQRIQCRAKLVEELAKFKCYTLFGDDGQPPLATPAVPSSLISMTKESASG